MRGEEGGGEERRGVLIALYLSMSLSRTDWKGKCQTESPTQCEGIGSVD
jgi:hypothetical protein